MIFEQEYSKWLTFQLNQKVREKYPALVCKAYDELSYKPLAHNVEEVAVVVSGGNAQRSPVPGLDQNTLPVSVMVICKEEYSMLVRGAIDAVQRAFNCVVVDIGGVDTKSVFVSPFVLDESDFRTDRATVKVSYIPFSATVVYGTTAFVSPPSVSLIVDGKAYQIRCIASYNCSANPSYDPYLPQGEDRMKQVAIAKANAYSFTVLRRAGKEGDELQALFEKELRCKDALWGKVLTLQFDDETPVPVEIPVETYQLTESYANNAAAYTLTLGV